MRYFGRLYDFDNDGKHDMETLQDLLDLYEPNKTTEKFDIESHMKKVCLRVD